MLIKNFIKILDTHWIFCTIEREGKYFCTRLTGMIHGKADYNYTEQLLALENLRCETIEELEDIIQQLDYQIRNNI